MANVYTLGQQVRCIATFKNSAGTATDPTGIIFKYRTPAGVVTTKTYGSDASPYKDTTGVYHHDLVLDESGEWWYGWYGNGAIVATDEERILVEGTRLA